MQLVVSSTTYTGFHDKVLIPFLGTLHLQLINRIMALIPALAIRKKNEEEEEEEENRAKKMKRKTTRK